MNLNNLKEILIKKAEEADKIRGLIYSLGEDEFTSMIVESLKKMAAHGQHAGRGKKPNSMLAHFANTLTSNADVAIIRDALSHHLSHYKSALQNNQREKADAHLLKIFPLMHLIHKTSANSHGRLNHTAPNSKPWEMNYTTDEKGANGRFKRLTEGWKVRAASKRAREGKSIPNYRFVEMQPHLGHGDLRPDHQDSGYPWEDIQVGSNEDVLNNKAYLYEKEVTPDQSKFVAHPFDSHPIHEIFDEPGADHDESHAEKHAADLDKWYSSPEYHKAFDMALEATSKSENGFTKPSKRFYEGIPLQEQPMHAKISNSRIRGQELPDEAPTQKKATSTQDLPESLKRLIKPQQTLPPQVEQQTASKQGQSPQPAPKAAPSVKELPESLRNLFGKKV